MPPHDCADLEACEVAAPALTVRMEEGGNVRINEGVVGTLE
jgi:hypothetical protein